MMGIKGKYEFGHRRLTTIIKRLKFKDFSKLR